MKKLEIGVRRPGGQQNGSAWERFLQEFKMTAKVIHLQPGEPVPNDPFQKRIIPGSQLPKASIRTGDQADNWEEAISEGLKDILHQKNSSQFRNT